MFPLSKDRLHNNVVEINASSVLSVDSLQVVFYCIFAFDLPLALLLLHPTPLFSFFSFIYFCSFFNVRRTRFSLFLFSCMEWQEKEEHKAFHVCKGKWVKNNKGAGTPVYNLDTSWKMLGSLGHLDTTSVPYTPFLHCASLTLPTLPTMPHDLP